MEKLFLNSPPGGQAGELVSDKHCKEGNEDSIQEFGDETRMIWKICLE